MILLLLACAVPNRLVLVELAPEQRAVLCAEAAGQAPDCGMEFDRGACEAALEGFPATCDATVEDWRACRAAYAQAGCEAVLELPDACDWAAEPGCTPD